MFIQELIGETTEYDKKVALEVKKPKSWLKSISAFANGVGGVLFFGVADDDTIVGLEDIQHASEVISELVKTKMDPTSEILMKIHNVDEKNILSLEVLQGDETPYYYVAEGTHTAYVRIGNESVTANSIDLKRLVLRGKNKSFDSLTSDFKMEDFSFSKLRSAYYKRAHKSMEENDFESFGVVDANGMLTNAGALLADEGPIRYSRLFCTRWNGVDKASGIMDAMDDSEYSGSLILLLEEGVNFVKRNSKKMWKKVATARIEYPDYAERSIFEGLVNALVHRDYLNYGSEVHIDIFDDRLEIYSPGGMFDGTLIQERDIEQVPSARRNPIVADIFNRLNFMERRGSGFKKIKRAYETEANYNDSLAPQFFSNRTEFVLTLKNLNFKTSGDEVLNEVLDEVLNLNEERIISLLLEKPCMMQKELAENLNISMSTVQREMKWLSQTGYIKRIGSKRKGYWKIMKEQ